MINLDACAYCRIEQCGQRSPVEPTGLDNRPLVYVVQEAPSPEISKTRGESMGPGDIVLDKILYEDLALPRGSVRIGYAAACRGFDGDSPRTPSDVELDICSDNIKDDILRVKPSAIVCMGANALKAFEPHFDGSVVAARNTKFIFEGIPLHVTYNPVYVVRSGGAGSNAYQQVLGDFRRILRLSNTKEVEYKLYDQYQVEEFLDRFRDSERLAFDYESNFHHPLHIKYRMAGFGFADENGSAYLKIKDFWTPNATLRPSTKKAVRDFLKKKDKEGRFIVFNYKYEVSVTAAQFNYELQSVDDMMQWCRTINLSGGLKEISKNLLGVDQWTQDLDEWNENWAAIWSHLKPTKTGQRKEYVILRDEGLDALIQYLSQGECNNREQAIKDGLYGILNTLHGLRGCNDEVHDTLREVICRKVENNDFQGDYTEMPVEICGYYCGKDCSTTLDLRNELYERLKKRNLLKAAEYYNEQGHLAYEMELNGNRWDENLAINLADQYLSTMVSELKSLMLIPKVRQVLEFSQQDILNIQASTDLDTLKSYYNPNSTGKEAAARFNAFFNNNQLKFSLALAEVNAEVLSNPNVKENYPFLWSVIEEIMALKESSERIRVIDEARSKVRDLHMEDKLSSSEVNIIKKWLQYTIDGTSSVIVESLYEAYNKIMGIDPDNQETWIEEFWILYHFRHFKKASKSLTTYIDGGVGRSTVYVVDKETAQLERVVPRVDYYWDKPVLDSDDKIYLYQPDYRPNSAETKRWKAGVHTVPWGSELKDLVISRFEPGILLHADGSQMEVRVLAAMANEETLLQAFRDGKDVHRSVAAKVWKIPEEQVNKAQRRFSKMATFSLLYGKTLEGFAQDFMGGDMAATTALFEDFFAAFPRIKDYIEESHELLKRDGEVPTLWGDPIVIPYDPNKKGSVNSAMRQAQNYRIQSTASNTIAVTLARISRIIQQRQMMTRIFGFTHDSMDADMPVRETFTILQQLPVLGEQLPLEEWNLPVKIDMEIGVTGNKMMTIEPVEGRSELVYIDGETSVFECDFGGDEEDGASPYAVEHVVNCLKGIGMDVTYDVTKEGTKYTSRSELFITRRAYSLDIGRNKTVQWGTLKAVGPATLLQ